MSSGAAGALFLAQMPVSAGWQMDALAVLAVVYLLQNIWNGFRRKPAVDEIFEKKLTQLSEATEKRLHLEGVAIEKRMQAQSDQTDKKIEALDRRRESGEGDIRQLVNDKVSQMEKFISDKINDNRTNHTEQFGFLRGELHAVRGTMQALSTEVSRAIGRLEGTDKPSR
jgi:hypothetical protein